MYERDRVQSHLYSYRRWWVVLSLLRGIFHGFGSLICQWGWRWQILWIKLMDALFFYSHTELLCAQDEVTSSFPYRWWWWKNVSNLNNRWCLIFIKMKINLTPLEFPDKVDFQIIFRPSSALIRVKGFLWRYIHFLEYNFQFFLCNL